VFEILKVGRLEIAGGTTIAVISAVAEVLPLVSGAEKLSVVLNVELAPETTKFGEEKLTTVAVVLEPSC
jgi:hypothetical protein